MNTLCTLRDIYRSIRDFDERFQQKYDLCLNEGMLLCSLKTDKLTSTQLAEALGLTTSNTSKVIKSVESKELIQRILGKDDKRQMYFTLSDLGKEKLMIIKQEEAQILKLMEQIESVAHQANSITV